MYITNDFKNKIASTFYDKDVAVLDTNVAVDDEGDAIRSGENVLYSFKGNCNINNCKAIQEEYGLDYEINIYITTFVDVNVAIGSVISYNDKKYKVTDVLTMDSHKAIVGQIWEQ